MEEARTLPCKYCDKEVEITVSWMPREAVCHECTQLCGICLERKSTKLINNGFLTIDICDAEECKQELSNIDL